MLCRPCQLDGTLGCTTTAIYQFYLVRAEKLEAIQTPRRASTVTACGAAESDQVLR